jgi:hypothetical protein
MRPTFFAAPVALAVAASACHQAPPPQVTAQPQIDSSALLRARHGRSEGRIRCRFEASTRMTSRS